MRTSERELEAVQLLTEEVEFTLQFLAFVVRERASGDRFLNGFLLILYSTWKKLGV